VASCLFCVAGLAAYELIAEMDPVEVAEEIIGDARLYYASYLHGRDRAALKARGF
jgi:hypothetical protein